MGNTKLGPWRFPLGVFMDSVLASFVQDLPPTKSRLIYFTIQ